MDDTEQIKTAWKLAAAKTLTQWGPNKKPTFCGIAVYSNGHKWQIVICILVQVTASYLPSETTLPEPMMTADIDAIKCYKATSN